MERKTCNNCYHDEPRTGCRLYSCDCATAVLNKAEMPPRWIGIPEGLAIEEQFLMKEVRKWKSGKMVTP